MKRLLYVIAVLLFVLQYSNMYAQTEQPEVRVSVCVGEERLENILTDSQKDSVTHLTITGTMTEEDYACLRQMFDRKLFELNLRDADIDTIPAHALAWEYDSPRRTSKRIILPSKLQCLADSSLCMNVEYYDKLTLVLTGEFPVLGKCVFSYGPVDVGNTCFEVSSDNEFCKEENDGIYSKDGTVLYYQNMPYDSYGDVEILDGTKVIGGGAFECRYNESLRDIVIPESVDSIGDRAFVYYHTNLVTGHWPTNCWPRIYCMAKNPPTLGKDVFWRCQSMLALIVPDDESVELYKAAEGWEHFTYIRPINNIGGDGVEGVKSDCKISVSDDGTRYLIYSTAKITHIGLYDAGGAVVMFGENCGKELVVDKGILKYPYTILRLSYDDGSNETVKLKP